MPGINFIFGFMLIKGFLWHGTYSQCDGAKKVISSGFGSIQNPIKLNFRDFRTLKKCDWEFSSPVEGYMLELTFVKLDFNLANSRPSRNGRCFNNVLMINGDQVCENNVRPGSSTTVCRAYYSSLACSDAAKKACINSEQTSFPVRVTYRERPSRRDSFPTTGQFQIEYKFTPCISPDCLSDDEDCETTGSGQTTAESVSIERGVVTETHSATTEMDMTTEITRDLLNVTFDPFETFFPDEQEPDTANNVDSNNLSMIPLIIMGVVIFILLVIIVVLSVLLRSSRRRRDITSTATQQNNNAPEDAIAYSPRSDTPYRPYLDTSEIGTARGATPEALKDGCYVNVPNGGNPDAENLYETPIQMQLYENNQR